MNPKHLDIRIKECLVLAQASNCPRLKVAAKLIDPKRNVVLADGYNGGPRGAAGHLCKGCWCERDGFQRDQVEIVRGSRHQYQQVGGSRSIPEIQVNYGDTKRIVAFTIGLAEEDSMRAKAEAWVDEMVAKNPPIQSGTHIEKGCHHAEMNVLMNACAQGISTVGAWMVVLAEPCVMCAKLIHHAGIVKVIVVDGGYAGGKAGVEYLRENGVEVEEIEGPRDPRLEK